MASRVICLSSISTPMSILINISKYFTILIKKKKTNRRDIPTLEKEERTIFVREEEKEKEEKEEEKE